MPAKTNVKRSGAMKLDKKIMEMLVTEIKNNEFSIVGGFALGSENPIEQITEQIREGDLNVNLAKRLCKYLGVSCTGNAQDIQERINAACGC